jgi:hypothetical protein
VTLLSMAKMTKPMMYRLQDTWRTVTVDDRIPLDLFGEQFKCGAGTL